jgi:hypothetical protein
MSALEIGVILLSIVSFVIFHLYTVGLEKL